MLTQGDFWVLVLVGLLIANLVFRFYVRLDLDKKISKLLQEVKSIKENLLNDKNVGELLREVNDIKANKNTGELVQQVKDVKENLIHIQQNFSNKLMDLLNDINTLGEKLPPYLRLSEKAIAYSVAIEVGK